MTASAAEEYACGSPPSASTGEATRVVSHGLLIAALAGAARTDRDAQPRRRADAASPTAARSRSAAANGQRTRRTRTAPATSTEFRLESGLPVWRYEVEGLVIEKRVFLPHMQNTVHVMYELLAGRAIASSWRCARR